MKTTYKKILFSILSVSCISAFAQTTQTFNYTGGQQTFVVPSCVTSINVDVIGAVGGGDGGTYAGGSGGRVQGTLPVVPGQTLYIYVGGQGSQAATGGYNGGGQGINTTGGGGGGASDIRIGGTTLSDRKIVAGGGGGGTNNGGSSLGGAGGGLVGGNGGIGGNPWGCTNLTAATGGTQSAGGLGGTSNSCAWNGSNGTFGVGGDTYLVYTSAGGGGGWYGGGGAHNGCAGAGGSSYTDPLVTSVIHTQGYRIGDGQVILTYTSGLTPNPISGPASLCANTTGTYTMPTVVGATNYTWTAQSGLTITAGQGTNTVTVSCVTSGTISCVADNGSCFTNPMTFSITVNPVPTVTANSTASSVCAGDMVTLTGGGATTYTWDNSVMNGVAFVPTATTTYMVTGTSPGGCTNTATTTVTVNPLPTVVANSTASAVCIGDMVTLTGSGATSYTWDNSVMDGVAFMPSSTMSYMVTGTDGNGCMNTDMTTVTVNALPVVNLGADVTQCGGTVVLDAQNSGSTYLWSDASTMMTDTISMTGNYIVVVTDANGCMASDTAMITINAMPVVDLGIDTTVCGGSVMLDAMNSGSTYMWNDATTTQTNTVSMSGTYYVDVIDANGCMGSDTVMITINTPPTVTGSAASSTVCVDDASVALTGSPTGGTWTGPGVTGSMFNPSVAGLGSQSVGYSFTDTSGCESSAIVTILVNACTGVVENNLLNGVNVYPNPTSGALTINVNANVGNMQIEMTDLQGKIVYSSLENNVNAGFAKQISIENLANGIYMLKLTTNAEQNTIKVTVQK